MTNQRRQFTDAEIADMLDMYEHEKSATPISQKYHYFIAGVTRILKENGRHIWQSRNFTDAEEDEIVKIYLAGYGVKRIARAYRLPCHVSISHAIKRRGISIRPNSIANRLYKLNPFVFDVITEDAAYWWGFIYADGTINREKTLVVSLKYTETEHLEKLKLFLESNSPIGIYDNHIGKKEYHSAHLAATDRHLAGRMKELGIVPGRHSFPSVIQYLPVQYYKDWIRGFLDGDGTVIRQKNKQNIIGFSGQQDVLEWIREHLACQLGISHSPIRKHTISDHRYLSYVGNVIASRVAQYLYVGAKTYLSRKRDKALEIHPLRHKIQ